MESKGGEIRRVHIIYFLSRMGRIEHPHLIRVHHMNRSGVHLRDVKRWLSDLRGKEMPDSFAWSYKRRYKRGYVWQDLLDDDLITPISDNEYVLKGSEISAFSFESCDSAEKTISIQKSDPVEKEEYDSVVKRDVDENSLESEHGKEKLKDCDMEFSCLDDGLDKKEKERSERPSISKSKSSRGASQMLCNILTCGAIDTNESVMMKMNRRGTRNPENKREICKVDGVGGAQRVFGGAWNQQQQKPQTSRKSFDRLKSWKKNNASGNQKPVSATCKPVLEPNCSQCGKAFNPEKLHAHMKSCKALKGRGKGGDKQSQTDQDELVTHPLVV